MKLKLTVLFLVILLSFEVKSSVDLVLDQKEPISNSASFILSPLNIILSNVQLPSNTVLKESYHITSPFASHYTFQQISYGKIVKNGEVKIHLKRDRSYLIQNFLNYSNVLGNLAYGKFLLPTADGLIPVEEVIFPNELTSIYQYVDENGIVILARDNNKYIKRDTTVFTKVFAVNPINSANTTYGGNYRDNNDQSNSSLDSQMYWKSIGAKFENGQFFLESKYVYFADLFAPIDSFPSFSNDSLTFTRDNKLFEMLNVYFHINTVGEYVSGLGYEAVADTVTVDVHSGGGDNSSFSPTDYTLRFGDGGVDDAEDGEVVVHEYAHSLSEKASPNNTFGRERESMEEGFCDYFSKAYSRTYNDNTTSKVFSWDGHNQFWDGFDIKTKRKYPIDLKNTKDGDRDMWSSGLMCLHDAIGREATDSLVFEHLFYQAANTTMRQMAKVILFVDSIDFGSRYHIPVLKCFEDAGFILKKPNGVIENSVSSTFTVKNQIGFAMGSGRLIVELPKGSTYVIYNALGQKVKDGSTINNLVLSPEEFKKGIYVIHIESEGKQYVQKILR